MSAAALFFRKTVLQLAHGDIKDVAGQCLQKEQQIF
jgi:hypothetical protein